MDMRKASDRIHDTLRVTLDWEEPAPDPSGAAFTVVARQQQAAKLSGNEPPAACITPGEKHPRFGVSLRYTGPLALLFLGQHRHKWPVRIASLLVDHFQLSPSDPDWNDAAKELRQIRMWAVRIGQAAVRYAADPCDGITPASVVKLSREAPCRFMGDGLPIVVKWKAVVEKAGMTWASLSPSVLHKADKVRLEYTVTLHDLFTLAKHGWPVMIPDLVHALDPDCNHNGLDWWLLKRHVEDLQDFHGIAEDMKPGWKRKPAGTIPPLGAVFAGDVRFLDSGPRAESRESPIVMAVPVRFDELRGQLSDGDVETMLSVARGESKSGKYVREYANRHGVPADPVAVEETLGDGILPDKPAVTPSRFQEINDTLKALQATSPSSPAPKDPPAAPEPLKEGTGSPLAGAENKTCAISSGGREAVLKAAREDFPDVNIANDDQITPTGGGYWVSCRVFVPRVVTDEVHDGPYAEFLPLGKEKSEFNREVRGTMDDGQRLRETGKAGL